MDFYTYLYPSEYVAQVIVILQIVLFGVWACAVVGFFFRDVRLAGKLRTLGVSELQRKASTAAESGLFAGSTVAGKKPTILPSNEHIRGHINALRASGEKGKSLDIAGLIRNTNSKLTANGTWLRSALSLFIIIGLLGTLWGLASSLNHLATLSVGGAEITNESLAQGLNVLLGKLGGAFAPSIWGVSFTIAGVFFFAFYLRAASIPLTITIERETLVNWAPLLAKQRTDESVLMRENISAAQQIGAAAQSIGANVDKLVTTFNENLPDLVKNLTESVSQISEKLSNDATELADDVKKARGTLKALTVASENLNTFAETFRESVEKLYPFADATELRTLYEQLLGRSLTIIDDHHVFQEKVNRQLDDHLSQKQILSEAVGSFQKKMIEASTAIAAEMGGTSIAAREAFDRLSQQNETVITELVNRVGTPVAQALLPMPSTLRDIEREVSRINTPLEGVKESMERTSFKVVEFAEARLGKMDEKLQAQISNLETLSVSINNLTPKIEDLGNRIGTFNSNVNSIGERIDRFDSQSRALTAKLDASIALGSRRPREPEPGIPVQPSRSPGFFSRIKTRIFGG